MSSEPNSMIITSDLCRTFESPNGETVQAVNGISLSVSRGQLVALLGPNGAGKTTLMRMLSTLLPPTSGTAYVAGLDVCKAAAQVRSRIGYVGQGNSSGHNQRAVDEVVFQSRIYGKDRLAATQRARELFRQFGLDGLEARRIQEMSGGQRRRLDLAIGLVNEPSLLFLDEPTSGLDPQNRANLWELIRQIRGRTGMTVVVTTHYLEEADAMADRVLIVDHGRILADGTAQDLKQTHVGSRIVLELDEPTEAKRFSRYLVNKPEVIAVSAEDSCVIVQVKHPRVVLPMLIALGVNQGIRILGADFHEPTLDDVFLALTGRALRDASESNEEY